MSALEEVKKQNKKQSADEVLYNPPNQVMSHEIIWFGHYAIIQFFPPNQITPETLIQISLWNKMKRAVNLLKLFVTQSFPE